MNIAFRLADMDDLATIHEIRRDAILGSALVGLSLAERQAWADRRSPDFFAPRVAEESLVIVEESGKPIAWGSSVENKITGIYVRSSYQRTGVGRKLMAKLELDIARRGHTIATLGSSPNAAMFYTKLGYVEVTPSNKEVAIPMEKDLIGGAS